MLTDKIRRRLRGINLEGKSAIDQLVVAIRYRPYGDGILAMTESETKNEIIKFAREVDLAELITIREGPTRAVKKLSKRTLRTAFSA